MKKIPVFWVLSVLLLLSASFGVSSAHAAAPNAATFTDLGCLGDGWYFRLECSGTGSSRVCQLSQEQKTPDENDFACWSDVSVGQNTKKGVRSALEETTNDNNISKIVLKSDLNFGLQKITGTTSVCNLNVSPLGPNHAGFDGDGKVIWGLCYISMAQNSSFGLFEEFHGSFTNVTFDQALVTASTGGILAIKLKDANISDVTIKASSVQGQFVGGLASSVDVSDPLDPTNSTSSITNVTFNSSLYLSAHKFSGNKGRVGGLIGAVNGGKLSISDVTIKGVEASVSPDISGNGYFEITDDLKVGGLVGFVSNNSELNVSNVSVEGKIQLSDQSYKNIGSVGGVFGASEASSLTIDNVTLKPVNFGSYDGDIVGGVVGSVKGGSGSVCEVNISNVKFSGNLSLSGGTVGGVIGESVRNGTSPGCNLKIEKVAASGNFSGESGGYVGGIIGYISGSWNNLTVKNTYSVGSIGEDGAHQGYIIGYDDGGYNDIVYNNYHFSTSDTVTKGIGNYDDNVWSSGDLSVQGSIYGNVRNASSANANHAGAVKKLGYHYKYTTETCCSMSNGPFLDFFDPGSKMRIANALVDGSEMKSGLLAALMNNNLESKGEPAIWASYNNINSGLPTFSENSDKTNRLIVLQIGKEDVLNNKGFDNSLKSATWNNQYSQIYYVSDRDDQSVLDPTYVSQDSGFTFYTDANGLLPLSVREDLKIIMDTGKNKFNEDFQFIDADGNEIDTTAAFDSKQRWIAGKKTTKKLFCFNGSGNIAFLHQSLFNVSGEKCFEHWYDPNGYNDPLNGAFADASSYAQEWYNGSERSIVLTSNIEFAGYDSQTDACVDAPNAFKGKYLTLGDGDVIKSKDGSRYTISGLCFASTSTSDREMGFVKIGNSTADLRNVAFKDVYFKLPSSNKSVASIILLDAAKDAIGDISVEKSYFNADTVGAILGNCYQDGNLAFKNISVSDVVVDGKFAGSVAGSVLTNGVAAFSVENVFVEGAKVSGQYVGGVIGTFVGIRSVSLQNISVAGTITGSTISGGLAGSIVCLAGVTVTINNTNVLADVSGVNAGGLVGSFGNRDDQSFGTPTFNITNNYVIGDITCPSNTSCGYLAGHFGYDKPMNFNITDNYYFGKTDASVKYGFPSYKDDNYREVDVTDDWWHNPDFTDVNGGTGTVARNFRNAITTGLTTLDADGVLYYDADTPIHVSGTTTKYANGVIPAEQMTNGRLAAVLNLGAANPADMLWTVKGSATPSINDGLPVFRVSGENPSYPVKLDLADFDVRASQKQKKTLSDASSIHPVDSIGANVDGSPINGVVLFTDYNGNLASSDVAFANSLLVYGGNANNDVWKDDQNNSVSLSSSTSYDNGLTVYTFSSQQPIPYFCFADSTNANGDVVGLKFSQINVASPSTNDGTCFAYWYNDNADHANGATPDAYSYAQKWLNANEGSIALTTDIAFAGHTGNVCNDAPNAFKGKYLSLGENDSLKSEAGKRYTISGLCYTDDNDDVTIGFVKIEDIKGNIENINFDNVYFVLKSSGNTSSGVVWLDVDGVDHLGDISVENSEFQGSNAGAFAGSIKNVGVLQNISVSGTKLRSYEGYIGGVVGYVENVKEVKNIRVDNPNLHAVGSSNPTAVGAVFGYALINLNDDVSITDISVSGIFTASSYYQAVMGGIVGRFNLMGPKSISFSDISVNADETQVSAEIGGLVGVFDVNDGGTGTTVSIERASVTSNYSFSTQAPSYDVFEPNATGGLIGYFRANFTSNNDNFSLNIKNTYTVVDLSGAPAEGVGYLVGAVKAYLVGAVNAEYHSKIKYDIVNNYHYGKSDAGVISGIGAFVDATNSATAISAGDWKNASVSAATGSSIYFNFRNAITTGTNTLAADGYLLNYNADDYNSMNPGILNGNVVYPNGVVPESQMKSGIMAALFNLGSNYNQSKWTYVEGQNNNLPVLRGANDKPTYPVFLDIDSYYATVDATNKQTFLDALTQNERLLETVYLYKNYVQGQPILAGNTLIFYTNSEGKLAQNDIDLITSATATNASWAAKEGTYVLNSSQDFSTNYDASNPPIFAYKSCLGGNKYFNLVCATVNGIPECHLKPNETTTPSGDDFKCWDDIVRVLGSSKLVLEDDIDLGGYDATTGRCRLSVPMIEMNSYGFDGGGKTITGLCHLIAGADSSFALFNRFYGPDSDTLYIKNVTFKDVHIEGHQVGVLALSLADNMRQITKVSKVSVEDAYLSGDLRVGAVASQIMMAYNFIDSVSLKNVTITSLQGVTTSNESNGIHFGGIAGWVTWAGYARITNATVDKLTINNSIFNSNGGAFGGIVGLGRSGSTEILNATITNANISSDYSRVGGIGNNIDSLFQVSFSGNVSGPYADYIGGLVGNDVDSIYQASFTGNVSGAEASYIGGIVGSAANYISNASFTGDVYGGNSTNPSGSCIGGIVGSDGGYITETSFTGNVTGNAAAYIGGIVGRDAWGIDGISFNGDISGGNSTGYVGGIVGGNPGGFIVATYTVGDIKNSDDSKTGYLIGYVDDKTAFLNQASVFSNYHYGKDDASVTKAVASLTDDEWKNATRSELSYNFRNAITTGTNTLDADGDLQRGAEPIRHDDGNGTITTYVNGIIPAAQMETPRFAAVLNQPIAASNGAAWTIDNSATSPANEGLPYLADGINTQPIYEIGLDEASFLAVVDASSPLMADWNTQVSSRSIESIDATHNGLLLFTDNTGKLSSADLGVANGLQGSDNSWYNATYGLDQEFTSNALFTYRGPVDYFCFEDNATDKVLNFSQTRTGPNPSTSTMKCFDYWYNDNCATRGDDNNPNADSVKCDARTYAQAWLDANDGSIVLNSNIAFAGYQINLDNSGVPTDTACVNSLNSFNGKFLTLGANDVIKSKDNVRDTIKGLCYVDANSQAAAHGFVKIDDATAKLTNVAFDSAFFNVPNNVGLMFFGDVDGNNHGFEITDITVKNSIFKSNNSSVGAIAGFVPTLKKLENIDLDNVVVNGNITGYLAGAYYSVGGVVGGVQAFYDVSGTNCVADELSVKNISANKLTVEGVGSTYPKVGGVIGQIKSCSKPITFENVAINEGIISSIDEVGGLLGTFDTHDNNAAGISIKIHKSKVLADITVTGSYKVAGGLVGRISTASAGSNKIDVRENYVIGDITSSNESRGYLIGAIGAPGSGPTVYTITDNYHYGTNDNNIASGIGTVGSYAFTSRYDGYGYTATPWSEACWSYQSGWACDAINEDNFGSIVARNFRNVLQGATSSEDLHVDGDLLFVNSDKPVYTYDASNSQDVYYYNGIIPAAQMGKKLAAILNQGEGVWTVDANVNNGMPVFLEGSANPLYAVRFDLTDFDVKASAQERADLQAAIATYPMEKVDATHEGFIVYTESSGQLNSSDVDFVNKLVNGTSSSWDGSLAWDDNQVYTGNALYTYKSTLKIPYFCFEEDATDNTILYLTQPVALTKPSGNANCFAYWYNDNCATRGDAANLNADSIKCDARTYAQYWLNEGAHTIVLQSDSISFAGKQVLVDNDGNPTDTVCVDAPNAFKGKYLTLGNGDLIQSETGKLDTIKGLCYKSDVDNTIGFVLINKGVGIDNVAFSDVYFKLGTDDYHKKAGVLMLERGVSLESQHITVVNSEFRGYYAGAIAGEIENCAKIANKTVSNVKVDGIYVGGVVGSLGYNNTTSKVSISDISVSAVTLNGSTSVGGISAGTTSFNHGGFEFKSISVDGIINGGSAGGLVDDIALNAGKPLSVQNVKVIGDITGSSVGGLVNTINVKKATSGTNSSPSNITIKNTYSKGGLHTDNYNDAYLIFAIYVDFNLFNRISETDKALINFDVTDNYHYSTEEYSGVLGIRNFDAWKEPYTIAGVTGTIARNFSSSDESLNGYNPDGNLRYHKTLPIMGYDGHEYANGRIPEEQMKNSRLAVVLNMGAASENDKVWTVKSGVGGVPLNDGLPVFMEAGDTPPYAVKFDLANFDDKANETQLAALNDAATNKPSVYVDAAHTEMYLFTDNMGYISLDDAELVNKLVRGTSSSWYDENGLVATFSTSNPNQYSNDQTVYTYQSADKTKYFCFEKDGDNLNFSQEEAVSNPSVGEKYCFAYWYKDNADHSNGTPDAYTYAQNWLDNNTDAGGSIVLISETIEFAGKQIVDDNSGNATDTVCVNAPNAFKGHYLDLGANDVITSEAGKVHTIAGLCYTSDVSYNGDARFARIKDVSANLTKLAFKDVFFKVSGYNANAGLIDFYVSPSLVSDISVESSTFESKHFAGAIAGSMNGVEAIKDITIKDVNVIVEYNEIYEDAAGGIAAVITAKNGLSVSNVSLSDVNVKCICWIGTGGVIGRINNADKKISLKNISVGGSIQGLEPGGLVGYLNTEKKSSTELYATAAYTIENSHFAGTVMGNVTSTAAGGLVGSIEIATTGETSLQIKNNYVLGSVRNGGSMERYPGYLVSSIDSVRGYNVGINMSNIRFDVTDNYYYAENNAWASEGIGVVR
ncbi:MAG: hypothetical protein J6S84_03900, partial [Bacteroidales bacterium]|nr:hypothetical protein [Bacteroidales bacterium]